MAYDTAEEVGPNTAYTALVVLDYIPWQRGYAALVRHVWRGRVDSGELLPLVIEQAREFDNGKLSTIVVEFASSGKMLTKQLKINAPVHIRRLITKYPPRDSKDARQYAAAMPCQAGRVWLPYPHERAPWLSAFTTELYAVPQSKYRDQTDAFAVGILWGRNYLRSPEEQRNNDAHIAA
jgi:phage terminase large subunit-like protein